MPHTTAVDSASAMVRPPRLTQLGHRVGAVAPHAGHQDADQLARRRSAPARSSPSARRSDARDSRAAPAPASHSGPTPGCDHDIGIAPADIDRSRLQAASDGSTSTTSSSHFRSSRLAKAAVKLAGMCCATITGQGNCCGNCGSTMSSAAGPPVDVPIRTRPGRRLRAVRRRCWPTRTRPVATARRRREIDAGCAPSAAASGGSAPWRRREPSRPGSDAADRSPAKPCRSAWRRSRSRRARWPRASLRRLRRSATEIITTGRGASIMIWLRQVSPSMPGICTSSVTTCGSKDRTSSSASVPLRAS